MGDVIPFAEAADRIRVRRARVAFGPADWFWATSVCFVPLCLTIIAAQTVFDVAATWGRRR